MPVAGKFRDPRFISKLVLDARRCSKRIGFRSECEARHAARRYGGSHGEMTVRRCSVCGRWHVERGRGA